MFSYTTTLSLQGERESKCVDAAASEEAKLMCTTEMPSSASYSRLRGCEVAALDKRKEERAEDARERQRTEEKSPLLQQQRTSARRLSRLQFDEAMPCCPGFIIVYIVVSCK